MSFRAIEAFLVIVWNKKRVGYTYELTLKVKGELNLRGEKSVGGHIDVPEFSFGELDDLQHKVCSSDQPRWKPAKRLGFCLFHSATRSLFQGELELPFLALLLVILSHYEVMRFRNTKEGAIISLLIAVYLTYQHFSRTSLQKSLDQGSIVATIAVVCITIASLLFLI
ncbi:hypothetical protein S83_015747 [Arachis hypogaea]